MKINKQAEQSKLWLTEALFELMQKKPFHSITIKELSEKAGVSRLTFYRNFETKEDILENYFHNLFDTFLDTIQNIDNLTLQDVFITIYSFWDKNRLNIQALSDNKLEALLYTPFNQYLDILLDRFQISKELNKVQKDFIVGGLFFTMIRWIKNNDSSTPTEMAESVLGILTLPKH